MAVFVEPVDGIEDDVACGTVIPLAFTGSVDEEAGAVTEFRAAGVGGIGIDIRNGLLAIFFLGSEDGAFAARVEFSLRRFTVFVKDGIWFT